MVIIIKIWDFSGDKFQLPAASPAVCCSNCYSCRFLLSNKLLWCPDRWRTSSCSVSKYRVQKQHVYRPPASGALIMFRCTEQRCFSRWAFCLNIATHSRQAKGFSPVCTRRWVFRFHDMPNCLPQYSQRYSRTGALPPPLEADVLLLRLCDGAGAKSLFESLALPPCRLGGRPNKSAGAPGSPKPWCGHEYTNDGAIASGLSTDGGRRRLLLLLLW